VIRLTLSRSQRRATEQAEGTVSGGVGGVREEHTMEPKAGDVGRGGGVLACKEVGIDHTGRKVVGRPEVVS
jgi:hypothetical protein